jgi:phenylpropionate dioxygenase-like ring-hydroxylating dioxygenase large terminal subunit
VTDEDEHARELMRRLGRMLDAAKNEGALEAPLHMSSDEYTDPDLYARELRHVIRRRLLPVTPLSSLREPGAHTCKELAGERLLATRDMSGSTRLLHNRCRHRGTLLVRGSRSAERGAGRASGGSGEEENDCSLARRLVCPYHGWTYELDGSIAHVPERETGFPGMDDASLSLERVHHRELAGMLWASLDAPSTASPELERLESELARLELGSHQVVDARRVSGAFNWKLGVNSFLETYHFKVAHRTGIAPHFVNNRILVDAFGESLRLTLPRTSFVEQMTKLPFDAWELRPHVSFVYFIFPCSFLSVLPDHASFITFLPDGLARTCVESHIFVPEDTRRSDEYWEKNAALFQQTVAEDIALSESIQRGLGAREQIFTFATFENALAHFRASVQRIVA